MRVASWNLWWRFGNQWAERHGRILKELRTAAPDVMGLQEVWATDGTSQADVKFRRHPLPSTHRPFEPVVLMVTLDHPAGPLHVFTTATECEPSFADDHLAQTRRLVELVSDPALEGPLPVLLAADLNAAPNAPELRATRPAHRLRASTQHRHEHCAGRASLDRRPAGRWAPSVGPRRRGVDLRLTA